MKNYGEDNLLLELASISDFHSNFEFRFSTFEFSLLPNLQHEVGNLVPGFEQEHVRDLGRNVNDVAGAEVVALAALNRPTAVLPGAGRLPSLSFASSDKSGVPAYHHEQVGVVVMNLNLPSPFAVGHHGEMVPKLVQVLHGELRLVNFGRELLLIPLDWDAL